MESQNKKKKNFFEDKGLPLGYAKIEKKKIIKKELSRVRIVSSDFHNTDSYYVVSSNKPIAMTFKNKI